MDARLNLTVDQGAAFDRTFVWRRPTGTPVNLTGYTALLEVIGPDGGAPILSLTQGAGITLGGSAGTIKVHIDAAGTAALDTTGRYPLSYTLTVTGGSPSRSMRIASGAFNVAEAGSRSNGVRRLVDDRELGIVEAYDELDLFVDASEVAFTPAGTIAAGNVQAALEEVAAEATAGDGGAALAAHVAAADPHTGYQKESEKGSANGYAALDGTGVVPDAQIPAAIARDSEVTAAITAVINAAPGALDTLKELADAIGDDANFAATITTALAGKQPLDADLTAIAAVASQTSFGRALLAIADAAALATLLGPALPGHVFSHTTRSTSLAPSATSDAAAETFLASDAVTYDGSTLLKIEFSATDGYASQNAQLIGTLWDSVAGDLGRIFFVGSPDAANSTFEAVTRVLYLMPSAGLHTLTVKIWKTSGACGLQADVGTPGLNMPASLMITRAV